MIKNQIPIPKVSNFVHNTSPVHFEQKIKCFKMPLYKKHVRFYKKETTLRYEKLKILLSLGCSKCKIREGIRRSTGL